MSATTTIMVNLIRRDLASDWPLLIMRTTTARRAVVAPIRNAVLLTIMHRSRHVELPKNWCLA